MQGSQEEKELAQQKFVAIQQSYEKLSTLKKQRARANRKSDKKEEEEEVVVRGQEEREKVEL